MGGVERGAGPLTSNDYDVAVIGLGPTGATMAHLLAVCGLRVLAVDREHGIHPLPRAVHFDGEIMRIFQTIGIADLVDEVSRINPGMRFVDPDGNSLLEWPRPQDVGPQGWFPSYRFHQPDLETILRRTLLDRPNAEIRLGTDVIALQQSDAGVRVTCDQSGARSDITADYVVGCDGAKSTVRATIGGGSQNLGFNERWLVVDLTLKRDRPDLGDFTVQHCHPTQAMTYVRGPGNRRRWEISLNGEPGEVSETPAFIWKKLQRWISPDDADIERAAIYTFHSTIASQWRDRRLFIAGDAAHQMPPFMGQGMCSGLRDVANLAWKIALACRQGGAADWLESYQDERQDHTRQYIETSANLGRLINASDPKAALENAFVGHDGKPMMRSPSVRLGPGPWPRARDENGFLFGQPLLASGVLCDDATGYAAVLFAEAAILTAEQRRIARDRGIAVVSTTDSAAATDMLQSLGAAAVLVRPDRYIFDTATEHGEVQHLLEAAPSSPLTRPSGTN